MKYGSVRRVTQILLQKQSVVSALEESRKVVENLRNLIEQFKTLQSSVYTQQLMRINQLITRLESHYEEKEVKGGST